MVASQHLKSFGRCNIFHFILFYFYCYFFLSGEVAHQKQLRNSSTEFKLLRGCLALMHLLARNAINKKKLYLVLARSKLYL